MKHLPLSSLPYCGYKDGHPYHCDEQAHGAVFAPTGGGKTSSLIFPTALTMVESAVFTDPKGENWITTSEKRKSFGHAFRLDPIKITGDSDGFNVLHGIKSADLRFEAMCKQVAEAIVVKSENDANPHWVDSSILLVKVLIMAAILYAERGNMTTHIGDVMKMLFLQDRPTDKRAQDLEKLKEILAFDPYDEKQLENLKRLKKILETDTASDIKKAHSFDELIAILATDAYEPLAMLARRFIRNIRDDRELESVLKVCRTQCEPLTERAFAEDLAKHPKIGDENFTADMLKRRNDYKDAEGKRRKGYGAISIYIIIPADMLKTHGCWIRLVTAYLINGLMRTPPSDSCPRFFLDEIGNIGVLKALKNAMSVARGFGFWICCFWQYMRQIAEIYGNDAMDAFLVNTGWICTFATSDRSTKEYFSDRAGTRTVIALTISKGKSGANSASVDSEVTGKNAQSFPVVRQEDIPALPERTTLNFFSRPQHPFILDTPLYTKICSGHSVNPFARKAA